VGHTNASRIFDSYVATVGHGAILNCNCPAERTGKMNASLASVMHEAGAAINATFRAAPLAGAYALSTPCGTPIELPLPGSGGQPFDYIVTREDLLQGQRVANYSFEFQRVGSSAWEILVPPANATRALGDRPDGHDPRDQYIGRLRIDTPIVATGAAAGAAAVPVARIRFNCIRSLYDPVHLASIEVRVKQTPWS
jgi:hypothetical protein